MASTAFPGEAVFTLVHGHHVYKAIWTPQNAEHLGVAREDGNGHDHFAVRVFKNETGTVGYVPKEYMSHDFQPIRSFRNCALEHT